MSFSRRYRIRLISLIIPLPTMAVFIITGLLTLALMCTAPRNVAGPSDEPEQSVHWSEIGINSITTLTGDKGSTITAELSGQGSDSLLMHGRVETWGWALASVAAALDLSTTDSIVFYAGSPTPNELTLGISDNRKIQYVTRITLNGGGTERIAVCPADFQKTVYPDPDAPADEPIDLSNITGVQFQPLNLDTFDITLGPLTFIRGPKPVVIRSDVTLDFSELRPMKKLSVSGSTVIDENGNAIVLKGMCAGDPAQMIQENRWNEDYFREASLWGAHIFRIPVSPWSYHQAGGIKRIFTDLDQSVYWCKKYRMYAVIEWHSCGNIVQGIFQDPSSGYETTMPELVDFWRRVSTKYRNEPTAAFYEIFNEPAAMDRKGGTLTWKGWREKADEIIDTIYTYNPDAIPLVAGLDWAYDLSDYSSDPLRNTGFAFAVHPYAGRSGEPWEEHWETDFGYLAKNHPMIFTEIGFDPHDTIVPQIYRATEDYGRRILDFAGARGISWTAFVFYQGSGWPMPLFSNWDDFTPTISGTFFKDELKRY